MLQSVFARRRATCARHMVAALDLVGAGRACVAQLGELAADDDLPHLVGGVDFICELGGGSVFPIEVKSGKDYKKHSALTNV